MSLTVVAHRLLLGYSVQKRPIEGVLFGSPEAATLDTLFIGAFHGDEEISTELLNHWIESLQAGNFAKGPIDFAQKPILIVPALNPDGLALDTRMNANGVDLNRNYPTPEWQEENQGTIYYSGSAPGSEPETRLVMSLIEKYRPRKIVTVHSPYKVLNFDGPGQALAEAMAAESGYPVVADIGYPTPGSFGTYAGKIRQIPVVTLELPPNPDEEGGEPLEQVWRDNQAALEAAVRL
ncbi:MAG TPA: M14 family murein peptide amidase A [Oculatellaceae cyanobacterium]|jgi:protein MpaA